MTGFARLNRASVVVSVMAEAGTRAFGACVSKGLLDIYARLQDRNNCGRPEEWLLLDP